MCKWAVGSDAVVYPTGLVPFEEAVDRIFVRPHRFLLKTYHPLATMQRLLGTILLHVKVV